MGDQTMIVPYHNHRFEDVSDIEKFLMSEENLNLFEQSNAYDPSSPNSHDFKEILDANDPLVEEDLCGDDGEAGPSRIHEEPVGQENDRQYSNYTDGQDMRYAIPLSMWPLPAAPFTCSCCQILREITHTNGTEITKLEIHGRVGIICHAILDKVSGGVNQNHEYQMFDFSQKSVKSVKQFLVQYCEERRQTGYFIMVQDPLLDFYEALCVGLDWNSNHNNNMETDNLASGQQQHEVETMAEAEVETDVVVRLNRSSLAAQRERTSKLKLKDLVDYLHLPITQASKEMDICLTALKKICRRHGLSRWPYRKIKSVRRKISKVRESLNGTEDAGERVRAEVEIQRLHEKLATIFALFDESS